MKALDQRVAREKRENGEKSKRKSKKSERRRPFRAVGRDELVPPRLEWPSASVDPHQAIRPLLNRQSSSYSSFEREFRSSATLPSLEARLVVFMLSEGAPYAATPSRVMLRERCGVDEVGSEREGERAAQMEAERVRAAWVG